MIKKFFKNKFAIKLDWYIWDKKLGCGQITTPNITIYYSYDKEDIIPFCVNISFVFFVGSIELWFGDVKDLV